jgi:hypothetical protein
MGDNVGACSEIPDKRFAAEPWGPTRGFTERLYTPTPMKNISDAHAPMKNTYGPPTPIRNLYAD